MATVIKDQELYKRRNYFWKSWQPWAGISGQCQIIWKHQPWKRIQGISWLSFHITFPEGEINAPSNLSEDYSFFWEEKNKGLFSFSLVAITVKTHYAWFCNHNVITPWKMMLSSCIFSNKIIRIWEEVHSQTGSSISEGIASLKPPDFRGFKDKILSHRGIMHSEMSIQNQWNHIRPKQSQLQLAWFIRLYRMYSCFSLVNRYYNW